MKKNVYLVSHTHWDREWYFTIEDSNNLLYENMNYLINLYTKENLNIPFIFDGQISVVKDFLKIFPEKEKKLKKLIKEKKIIVGPWYTQADSLLINKESLIRNLLIGIIESNKYGNYMKIGYLPDIFGQNSYLPSIFNGFGIKYSILQRGIYTDDLKKNLNFIWKSPDKKYVKTNNLFFGYGVCEDINQDDDYIDNKLIPILNEIDNYNLNSNNILLPVGGDQKIINKNILKISKKLNKKISNYNFKISDYETFMEDSWKENQFNNIIEGELTGTQRSRIHKTIGSTRYDIKKLNNIVENKLLYILEPISIMADYIGIEYPKRRIDNIWTILFDVHSHDSMGGCNSDETNKEILNRLNRADRMIDGLLNILKKKISYLNTYTLKYNKIFLFNTNVKDSNYLKEIIIFTESKNFKLSKNKKEILYSIISQEKIESGSKVELTVNGEKEININEYYKTKILLKLNLKAFSVTEIIVTNLYNKKNKQEKKDETNEIENSYYKVIFDKNKLNLITNEEIINDFITFEDEGDYGDLYDFSPSKNSKKIIINKTKLISINKKELYEEMNLIYYAYLPQNINERNKNKCSHLIEIFTTIELRNEEEGLRVKHKINNTIKDHRLRVFLKTNISNVNKYYSDSAFTIIPRTLKNEKMVKWKELKYKEAPININKAENIILIENRNKNVGVILKGNKEYEIIDNSIAITLFRSVGILGKSNLEWRPGRASGINNKKVLTPDSQLLKILEFEYMFSISYNKSKYSIYEKLDQYIEKNSYYQIQNLDNYEDRLNRFEIPIPNKKKNMMKDKYLFKIIGNVYMSCFKKSEYNKSYILRLFNPSNKKEKFEILNKNMYRIYETNLDEVDKKEFLKFEIKPKSYITLKLIVKNQS